MNEYINPKKINFKTNPPEILNNETSILNSETREYIEALINLQVSVLDSCVSEATLKQLTELKFFKKLTIYNLYNRTKKLARNYPQRHLSHFMNGFSIEYKDKESPLDEETPELLKFDYDEMLLSLYQKKPQTLEKRIRIRDEEIRKLEQRIIQIKSYVISDSDKAEELEISMRRIQILKGLTNAILQKQSEINKRESEQQQIVLEQFLKENNLSLSEFEELNIKGGKKFLIKKYPHASIYIHK